ncbi:MAG TPA: hypothetical protein PKC29_03750 [Thermodesulfobacteriota bacterium]|nr:hypothetical protein [Thermodesulfobacteriota bacterium]
MKKFLITAALALGVFAFSPALTSSADEYYYGTSPDYIRRPWQGQYDAPGTTIIKRRETRQHRVYYVDPYNNVEYREYRYVEPDNEVEYREYHYVEPDNDVEYRYYVDPDGDVQYYYYSD